MSRPRLPQTPSRYRLLYSADGLAMTVSIAWLYPCSVRAGALPVSAALTLQAENGNAMQPSPSRSNSQAPPPHTTHVPAFETSFPEHPQDRQPPPAQQAQQPQQPPAQPAGGSNPFGASAFGAKAFPGPPGQPPARTASSGAFALPATPAPSLATGASSEVPGFPQTLPTAGEKQSLLLLLIPHVSWLSF